MNPKRPYKAVMLHISAKSLCVDSVAVVGSASFVTMRERDQKVPSSGWDCMYMIIRFLVDEGTLTPFGVPESPRSLAAILGSRGCDDASSRHAATFFAIVRRLNPASGISMIAMGFANGGPCSWVIQLSGEQFPPRRVGDFVAAANRDLLVRNGSWGLPILVAESADMYGELSDSDSEA